MPVGQLLVSNVISNDEHFFQLKLETTNQMEMIAIHRMGTCFIMAMIHWGQTLIVGGREPAFLMPTSVLCPTSCSGKFQALCPGHSDQYIIPGPLNAANGTMDWGCLMTQVHVSNWMSKSNWINHSFPVRWKSKCVLRCCSCHWICVAALSQNHFHSVPETQTVDHCSW